MVVLNCLHVLFSFILVLFPLSNSQRKIKDGHILHISDAKRYMAYLLRADKKEVPAYDAWLCGGAIVTPDFIVTSAACVEDVPYMYAVAGYSKYVKIDKLDQDQCTSKAKKKITFTCVPKNYVFSYEQITKWSNIDIAAVQVETPYDFSLTEPQPNCHWAPNKIEINYNERYQREGTDAMVLGWGHTTKFRNRKDKVDYNQAELHYSAIRLERKETCIDAYKHITGMTDIIKNYMICALGEGNIDSSGHQIIRAPPSADGCMGTFVRIAGLCQDPVKYAEFMAVNPHLTDAQRTMYLNHTKIKYEMYVEHYKQYQQQSQYKEKQAAVEVDPNQGYTFDDVVQISFRRNSSDAGNVTRRAGICQNDHGGPLVTWVGTEEVLIGVASAFLLNEAMECTGPYLFTSTHCNGAFLGCILNVTNEYIPPPPHLRMHPNSTTTADHSEFRRSFYCNMPTLGRNFEIIERRISWADHPDGPAANERGEDLLSQKHVNFNEGN